MTHFIVSRFTLFCLASFSIGCKSTPPPDPRLNGMQSLSKEFVGGWPKGRELTATDASRVRMAESVHAYHLGRLPSADRRELHEAHTVYRVEQDGRWDTRLPATPMQSSGVVLGIVEPTHKALPASAELAMQEKRQQEITQQTLATQERLVEIENSLLKRRSEYQEAMKVVDNLKSELASATSGKQSTEAALAESQKKLKEVTRQLDNEKQARRTLMESSMGGGTAKPN